MYQGSYLMAHDIQTMLGYHGNEIRFYDELLGGKGQWRNAGSPNLLDLLAVRYLLLPQAQAVPGFHQVLGPVTTTPGGPGVLLERDTVPPYVRVVPGAAKLPEDQVVPTVVDPRFPLNAVALYAGHGRASRPSRSEAAGSAGTASAVRARAGGVGAGPHADLARRRGGEARRISSDGGEPGIPTGTRRWTAGRRRCYRADHAC